MKTLKVFRQRMEVEFIWSGPRADHPEDVVVDALLNAGFEVVQVETQLREELVPRDRKAEVIG